MHHLKIVEQKLMILLLIMHILLILPMYNLIEFSDNYSHTSGSLWQFKRDEVIDNVDVTNDNNAPSFNHYECH